MFTRAPRRASAFVAAIVLLSISAGASAAATAPTPQDYSFDERGLTAYASWQSCDEPDAEGVTRCTSVDVFAFDGRQRNSDADFGKTNASFSYLCLTRHEEAFSEEGYVEEPFVEGGCVDDPDIEADDLDTVEVSAMVELAQESCIVIDPETGETICEPGPTRTVSVDIAFTGIGEITRDRWLSTGTFVIDGVRCHSLSATAGSGRDASATIQLDGEDHGPSQYAFLTDGRNRYAQRCAG
jgi:hypothetical protein